MGEVALLRSEAKSGKFKQLKSHFTLQSLSNFVACGWSDILHTEPNIMYYKCVTIGLAIPGKNDTVLLKIYLFHLIKS